MGDCYTFREELAIKYPMLGHALWEPDPGGLYDAVQVGDVGLIHGGCFHRLFNALLPSDHPSNPHPRDSLNYPEQLQPRMSDHIRRSRGYQKVFRSKSVTQAAQEPSVFALGPDDDAQVTFSCSTKQGALISLPFPTECMDTVAHGDFSKWIVKNIDDCMKLADDLGWGVNRMEDIILVTGRHLTKSWVHVAFSESRGGARVSFCVRVTGASSVHLEERNVTGGELKLGPNGGSLPENQCIFVRGYRVVRLLNIWPKLRGLAGPAPDIPEPDPESDTRLKSISIPADVHYQDPLHFLLEHIAERAPDCDFALVHDNDLEQIINSPVPVESLRPDILKGHIRNHAPEIYRVQCEASLDSESGSGAKVGIAKVATPSQDVFNALDKVTDISPSISPISTFKVIPKPYKHSLSSTKLGNSKGKSQKQADAQTESRRPPISPLASPDFHLTDLAYTKLILHALKYPDQTVNGVLLALTPTAGAPIVIVDAVPLCHWTNLKPSVELGLEKAAGYAQSRQLKVVGYYETQEHVRHMNLFYEDSRRIMGKIRDEFSTPVVLLLDRYKLDDESGAALASFVPPPGQTTISLHVQGILSFDWTIPNRTKHLIRQSDVSEMFWDFDDHPEDENVPCLTNDALEAALSSLE